VLGGDLPSLVGRRSAGGNEMLELCWEATTYWRPARCLAGEVSRTVLPAGDEAVDATARGASGEGSCRAWDLRRLCRAWDLQRGARAGRGISGEELMQFAGSPARSPDRRIAWALAGSSALIAGSRGR
jgi:hypothetical protein